MMKKTQKTPDFDRTLTFIKGAHGNQSYGGQPYWTHPFTVATILTTLWTDTTEDERLAALLHDVFEDTDYTEEQMLAMGYTQETVDIVKLLSRDKEGISYKDFIQQIADSGNKGAIRVKIADNRANSLPQNVESLPEEKRSIVKRYLKAMEVLYEALAVIAAQEDDPVTSMEYSMRVKALSYEIKEFQA